MTKGVRALLEVEGSMPGAALPPNPYAAGKAHEFLEWIRDVPAGSQTGLPRYLQAIYDERPDLRDAFPEVEVGETYGFSRWLTDWGRMEYSSIRLLGHRIDSPKMPFVSPRVLGGADVIGFLHAEHGIGEASRLLVEALRTAGVPVSALSYKNSKSRQGHPFESDDVGRYRTVIAAVNAEINEQVHQRFGADYFDKTYVIGQWFWELEKAPHWYKSAYRFVDELWAPTRFIAEMFTKDAPRRVTVTHMPLPLRRPRVVDSVTHAQFGLSSRFTFLFTFDFMSVMKRKNPIGLVEAFSHAFAPGEGPVLVLKSINAGSRPEQSRMLRDAISGRSDIVWIDEYFDAQQSAGLMNLCDCYVSLHRSEGLGLTIAEAMLLGKPVIATGYSGNMDFMSDTTSYVVPWKYTRVGEGAEAYDPKGRWAEPDLDAAGEMMRRIVERPDEARRIGQMAKTDLLERFTLERTGSRMSQRLSEVWSVLGNE